MFGEVLKHFDISKESRFFEQGEMCGKKFVSRTNVGNRKLD
ncbi:MAG: hypothetical protein N2560_07150 [Ignavibacteria bacterium]|nr:hypothetical protein [Ignavibacteria bacterium]